MASTSLVNIRLMATVSLGLLAAGLLLGPSDEAGQSAVLVTGAIAVGLVAMAVLLAFVAWRATTRAGNSVDRVTWWFGRVPAFVLAGVTLAALIARIARLIGLA